MKHLQWKLVSTNTIKTKFQFVQHKLCTFQRFAFGIRRANVNGPLLYQLTSLYWIRLKCSLQFVTINSHLLLYYLSVQWNLPNLTTVGVIKMCRIRKFQVYSNKLLSVQRLCRIEIIPDYTGPTEYNRYSHYYFTLQIGCRLKRRCICSHSLLFKRPIDLLLNLRHHWDNRVFTVYEFVWSRRNRAVVGRTNSREFL